MRNPGPFELTAVTFRTTAVTEYEGTPNAPATAKESVPFAGRVSPTVPLLHWAATLLRCPGFPGRVSQTRTGVIAA